MFGPRRDELVKFAFRSLTCGKESVACPSSPDTLQPAFPTLMLSRMPAPPLKRTWFRFSLRTFLVFVAASAAVSGWFSWKYREGLRQRAAVAAIQRSGGLVHYDHESWTHHAEKRCPKWLHSQLGEDFFVRAKFACVTNGKAGPAAFADLPGLTKIRGYGRTFDDESLAALRGHRRLESVSLRGTKVTDAGLAHLATMPRLQEVDLSYTKVTDAGISRLAACRGLQSLDLSETPITDAGLEPLATLPDLRKLQISLRTITLAGAKKLQQALPNCEIGPLSANVRDVPGPPAP